MNAVISAGELGICTSVKNLGPRRGGGIFDLSIYSIS